MDSTANALQAQIDDLRRTVRRQMWLLRGLLLAIFAAAAGGILMGQAWRNTTLQAEKIEIFDASGDKRITIGTADGTAYIVATDNQGRTRAAFGASDTASGVTVYDVQNRLQGGLLTQHQATPTLFLRTATNETIVETPVNSAPRTAPQNAADDPRWVEGRSVAGSIRQALDVHKARHSGKLPVVIKGPIRFSARNIRFDVESLRGLRYFNADDFVVESLDPDAGTYCIAVTGTHPNSPSGTYRIYSDGREDGP